MEEKLEIPNYVITALEAVRQGGKYNMWESVNVYREIFELGFYEAVNWLEGGCRHTRGNGYCNRDDCDEVIPSGKKYTAALIELGRINKMVDVLTGNEN